MVGFSINSQLQASVFFFFLSVYVLTLIGNIIIIAIIQTNDCLLHSPMYLFLSHLSFIEIIYTTTISPNLLDLILKRQKIITLSSCLIQLYLFLCLVSTENFLLATMAYDRYLAICKPLHYHTKMGNGKCKMLALFCWFGGFLINISPIILIYLIKYCDHPKINHFFCDVSPLLSLSCTDITSIQLLEHVAASMVLLSSCLVIVMSYILIVSAILKIQTSVGRKKAFSTCASHLTVVILFFVPGILIYISPLPQKSVSLNKWVSLLYTELTPLLNPFVYSLRNEDEKRGTGTFPNFFLHNYK
uniref:Olfactory receptor n=1 Tax=Pyxicephalus adspersus TaxID=30357 RepID=A0AAV3AHZ1_PYXAD|nr:TPA: hypothetical protein GDO54_013735 [Pyxicephalus adspersus]